MVLILDGSLEIVAHWWSNFGCLICLRHLFRSRAVTKLFFLDRCVICSELQVPWSWQTINLTHFHPPSYIVLNDIDRRSGNLEQTEFSFPKPNCHDHVTHFLPWQINWSNLTGLTVQIRGKRLPWKTGFCHGATSLRPSSYSLPPIPFRF